MRGVSRPCKTGGWGEGIDTERNSGANPTVASSVVTLPAMSHSSPAIPNVLTLQPHPHPPHPRSYSPSLGTTSMQLKLEALANGGSGSQGVPGRTGAPAGLPPLPHSPGRPGAGAGENTLFSRIKRWALRGGEGRAFGGGRRVREGGREG